MNKIHVHLFIYKTKEGYRMRNRIQGTIDANQQMRMGGNQNDETGLWSLNQSMNKQITDKNTGLITDAQCI